MERERANESASKEQLQIEELKVELEKLKSESQKSNAVENSLVAATGIVGAAALLNPILGTTAATVVALILAAAYIFLNVNKTLPKSEKESDQKDD